VFTAEIPLSTRLLLLVYIHRKNKSFIKKILIPEVLPIVEFELADDLVGGLAEAVDLIVFYTTLFTPFIYRPPN
jgi:hypothetical protein